MRRLGVCDGAESSLLALRSANECVLVGVCEVGGWTGGDLKGERDKVITSSQFKPSQRRPTEQPADRARTTPCLKKLSLEWFFQVYN